MELIRINLDITGKNSLIYIIERDKRKYDIRQFLFWVSAYYEPKVKKNILLSRVTFCKLLTSFLGRLLDWLRRESAIYFYEY